MAFWIDGNAFYECATSPSQSAQEVDETTFRQKAEEAHQAAMAALMEQVNAPAADAPGK